uniref:Uncharacterized protein n=1 Tax=Streptomyces conglobatus TaxID=1653203 RepID=A0A0K2Y941_9ACTN|nr:hypothetical protein [Streptomyces conglobatus]
MLPTALNIAVMLAGYLLIMGYLALGLRILRRHPAQPLPGPPVSGGRRGLPRRGWPGLIRRVLGTAVGGYLLLMAVVIGYYYGVARVPGQFLASAFTGAALMAGVALPLFFAASWLVVERGRRRKAGRAGQR